MSKPSYERWIMRRLTDKPPCKAIPKNSCVPLRGDPICRACYDQEMEEHELMRKEVDSEKV